MPPGRKADHRGKILLPRAREVEATGEVIEAEVLGGNQQIFQGTSQCDVELPPVGVRHWLASGNIGLQQDSVASHRKGHGWEFLADGARMAKRSRNRSWIFDVFGVGEILLGDFPGGFR